MRRKVLVGAVTVACLAGIWAYLDFVDFHLAEPATKVRADWNELFTQIFVIALVVAVFVWGLLLYALVRFRARKDGPKEGPHIHGNVKLEVAWTIAPAAVMAWLLVISFNGLFAIDQPQETPDFTVKVTAYRFGWIFEYPDHSQATNNTLRVEQGRMVKLEIRSNDVIHAFGVPQLSVMMDAVPGRTNFAWFKADKAGDYPFNCRELCGLGHSRMGGKVIVFAPGSEAGRMYGYAPPAPVAPDAGGTADNGTASLANGTKVDLGAFVLIPNKLQVGLGPNAFVVTNVDRIPHNLAIAKTYDSNKPQWISKDLTQGESDTIEATFDTDQTYVIWCNIPGHYQAGMKGTLTVGKGSGAVAEETPLLPGFEPLALVAAVPLAALLLRRRTP